VRPSNDVVQLDSRICRLGMEVDPIDTILGYDRGVVGVNDPVRPECVLIGEELESGETDAGSIGQVLSVDAKRPIKVWTKGVGLAFTNYMGAISVKCE
jgi:hypothetical protein